MFLDKKIRIRIYSFAKKITLPGFDKVPLSAVINIVIKELQQNNINNRAKAIAFSFFMALFPGIIFFFTLLPYIPLDAVQAHLFSLLRDVLPNDAMFDFVSNMVNDIIKKPREGLLSLVFLTSLYFSTNGVMSLIFAFNKNDILYKRRNVFKQRLLAVNITILLSFLLIVSIVLIIIGSDLLRLALEYFHLYSTWIRIAFNALRYFIILLLFFFSISLIYYYAPAVKEKWRFISVGSTVATILMVGISLVFSYFIQNFANYNELYGSLGSIIMVLMWLYFNALALLIGFEINASIYYNKSHKLL